MKKLIRRATFGVAMILLASCASRKAVTPSEPSPSGTPTALSSVVERVNANRHTEPCVTARMSMGLQSGSKKVSVGGSLRMKRDEVVQLSLVALGLMEVGRMELTPDHILIIDRMNRRYVKESYQDIAFFRQSGINFYTFQSLFWDELFLPDGDGTAPAARNFVVEKQGKQVALTNADSRSVMLTFVAETANGLVSQTRIAAKNAQSTALQWDYQGYTRLGEKEFPAKMQVQFQGASLPLSATFSLSNVKADSNWDVHTEVNESRFSRVKLQDVLTMLMKLAQ